MAKWMTKYRTIKAKKAAITRFFAQNETPTVSGLADVLGMKRNELLHSGNKDVVIRQAMNRIESFLEARAYGPNATGYIFGLKNNFGWQDTRTVTPPVPPGRKKARDMTDEELMDIIEGRA